MVTVGGEISGYCAIGRLKPAIRPASVMMIASTLAKIGRSMKKRAKLPMGYLAEAVAAATGAWPGACGATVAPGRTFTRLSTITWSPSFRPAVMIMSLPIQLEVVTGLGVTLFSGPTVI